ncbi:TraV family lipoprotein [Vibrio vulnificus]|uniref:TraV family lipoprotein n=1 Tax=Vibrio vulnificus TaxID=672 RepID=UPI003040ABDD
MKLRNVIALLVVGVLAGCAQSNTKADFDCPVQDGIPACLTTEEADAVGDIPKPANDVDAQQALNVETETKRTSYPIAKIEHVVNQEDDDRYKVDPLIHQPLRRFGGTERMWFAGWEDTENDVYADQQYLYWSKPGDWIVTEVGE